MQWCEVAVHTTTAGADIVGEAMVRFGATGTEIIDRADVPDPNQPGIYWELYDEKILEGMPIDVLVKGWFAMNEHLRDGLHSLKERMEELKRADFGIDLGTLVMERTEVADEDWAENWKKYYKPFRVGSRMVVKPTWEPYECAEGELLIELDPGMAFGTGTHETTYMCMELLGRYLTDGAHVMDVGTGSGILAIAAAKLGAGSVLAIDIDPDAVKVATDNVALNQVEQKVRVVCGDLMKGETMACGLAVANIVADAICMLLEPLNRHLAKGGLMICSGIIREREQDVLDAAQRAGYAALDRLEKGEWVALCLTAGV